MMASDVVKLGSTEVRIERRTEIPLLLVDFGKVRFGCSCCEARDLINALELATFNALFPSALIEGAK